MIYDSVKNSNLYSDIPWLKRIFEFIEANDLNSLSNGRNDIDGEDLFANVVEYETTEDDVKYESHIEYIDVHYILSGGERMSFDDVSRLEVSDPYDKDMEAILYKADIRDVVTTRPGDFVVFYPQEGHRGKIPLNGVGPLRKAVFKVKVK